MKRRDALVALPASAAWSWAGAAGAAGAGQTAVLQKGESVRWPLAELPLLGGQTLKTEALAGQAVVLVFWATHCPFCARHNPHVEKLHQAAAGKPLKVLTAAGDRDSRLVQQYMQQRRYSFPVTMQYAPLRAMFSTRGVIPLTVTIGRDGRVRDLIPGEMFEEDVLELLPRLSA
jgi:thiol-disulfide isomerase/thioredoxin